MHLWHNLYQGMGVFDTEKERPELFLFCQGGTGIFSTFEGGHISFYHSQKGVGWNKLTVSHPKWSFPSPREK